MCVDTTTIVNKTKDFRSTDKLFVEVGCGNCEECRNQRHFDMYMRMIKECEWCLNHSYNIYFSTHTFSDENLPRTFVPVFDENWKHIYDDEIKCFDSKDWGIYYDSIVKKLRRDYGIGVAGAPKLRYFVACEYGELNGRPHLHILWLCPSVCPPDKFYEIVKQNWETRGIMFPTKLENGRVWSVKLNKWKDEKPFQVNRVDCNYIKASYYASKYCCKDTFFYANENINRYLKHLRYKIHGLEALIKQKLGDDEILGKLFYYKKKLSDFRTHLPFYHCSHGFGASYLDDFDGLTEKEVCDKLNRGIDSISDNMKIYNFQYPKYIKTKLLYDTYILNEDGQDYDIERDKGQIRSVRRELNDIGKYYFDYIHQDTLERTFTKFRDDFVTLRFDKRYLKENNVTLPNITYDDKFFMNLSVYYCDIRNRVDEHFLRTFTSYNKSNDFFYKIPYELLYFNSKSVSLLSERKRFGLSADTLKRKLDYFYLFNDLVFKNYETLVRILTRYSHYERLSSNVVKKENRLRRSTLTHQIYV